MKPTLSLFVALLLVFGPRAAAGTCVVKGHPKGIELHSWQVAENDWRFALVPGTDRDKSENEIKSGVSCIHTLEKAEHLLAQLGEEDEMFCGEFTRFPLPPAATVAVLAVSASRSGAKLHVLRRDPRQ